MLMSEIGERYRASGKSSVFRNPRSWLGAMGIVAASAVATWGVQTSGLPNAGIVILGIHIGLLGFASWWLVSRGKIRSRWRAVVVAGALSLAGAGVVAFGNY